jgi:hypothetical protein
MATLRATTDHLPDCACVSASPQRGCSNMFQPLQYEKVTSPIASGNKLALLGSLSRGIAKKTPRKPQMLLLFNQTRTYIITNPIQSESLQLRITRLLTSIPEVLCFFRYQYFCWCPIPTWGPKRTSDPSKFETGIKISWIAKEHTTVIWCNMYPLVN